MSKGKSERTRPMTRTVVAAGGAAGGAEGDRTRPPSLIFHKQHPKAGSGPGALATSPDAAPPVIHVIDYGPGRHRVRKVDDVGDLETYKTAEHVAWIDIQGLGDPRVFRRLAEIFDIHPLSIADAINVPVRPKAEFFESNHQIITRMGHLTPEDGVLFEQVTLFVGKHYVISIQERAGDVFAPVRKRIEVGGRMHRFGADYLAYSLVDAIVDAYFPLLETLAEELEELERDMLEDPREDMLPRLYGIRRDLVALRRAIWPQREAIATLLRDDSPFFTDEVQRFLQDCYDHSVQISEVADGHRDIAASLADLYMSLSSHRMNEVMQVLTIMASIFIPLTFIAGVYGMNFEFMPELAQPWAYPAAIGLMAAIGIGMALYFRRKGWYGRRKRSSG